MNYRQIKSNITQWIASTNGHNIFTYLLFVIVATLFWFLTKLNEEVQKDISLPVTIENIPDGVTLLRSEPVVFNITLKDKGSSLIKYFFDEKTELKLNYLDINSGDNKLKISQQDALSAVRSIFGQAQIVSLKPDSVYIPYTSLPPKKVTVTANCTNIITEPRFVVSKIIVSPDSVNIYSTTNIPQEINSLITKPINLSNICDTTTVTVDLISPKGVMAKPNKVNVTICVVPLVKDSKQISVKPINIPEGRNLVTFPSNVDVSYLVPMDYFKSENIKISLVADFDQRNSTTSKIPLRIDVNSTILKNVTMSTDSVEYIIE